MDITIGQHIAHYQIKAYIGSGRIGSVYEAINLDDFSVIALKTIDLEMTGNLPETRRRFLQEVREFPRLDHPSIIKIYEAGIDTKADLLYMTSEFIPWRTLNSYLQQLRFNNQRLGVAEALIIIAQIAEALGYAHKNGIVHRDVRPNLVLFKLDDHPEESGALPGRAAISDFTMLTILDQEKEPFAGSLPYMAPEYFLSQTGDGRSDIYSLGILLYRLLTDRLPFSAETYAEAARQHPHQAPPPLRSIRPDLPESVETAVLKALDKDPNNRYETGAKMADELRAIAATLTDRMESQQIEEDADLVKTQIEAPELAALNAAWSAREDRMTVTRNLPHSLNRQIITIGRSESSDIVLSDTSVTRRHAQLERTPQGWQIRDLGSQNGTYLNGKPLLPDIPEPWDNRQTLRISSYFLHLHLSNDNEYNAIPFSVAVTPDEAEAPIGGRFDLQVAIRNDGATVDEYSLTMSRFPETWVTMPSKNIRLRPNQQTVIPLPIHPPLAKDTVAGSYRYLLTVASQANEQDIIAVPGLVKTLPAQEQFQARLAKAETKKDGRFRLILRNPGLTDKTLDISAENPAHKLRYRIWQRKPEAAQASGKTPPSGTLRGSTKTPKLGKLQFVRRLQAAPRAAWSRMQAAPRAALNRILPGLGSLFPQLKLPSSDTLRSGKEALPQKQEQPLWDKEVKNREEVIFPTDLFTQAQIAAGREGTIYLGISPRKRPFWGRGNLALPYEIEISDGNNHSETLSGQLSVKPRIRSGAMATVLVLLIMIACCFATYAALFRYNDLFPAVTASSADRDNDALSNAYEVYISETDPNDADSDNDTLPDGEEINRNLNPKDPDTDKDGLDDATELALTTNPHVADTDGDTLPDGLEIYSLGTDPLIVDELPVIIRLSPTPVRTAVPLLPTPTTTPAPSPQVEATATPVTVERPFVSLGQEDGYIVDDGSGGQLALADGETLQVGEGGNNGRQAKGFLSFDTSTLPANAQIESAVLQIYQIDSTGGMSNLGGLQLDIASSAGFNENSALENADFSATAGAFDVAEDEALLGNGRLLTLRLNESGINGINRQGSTQFRLYFILPNDNDGSEDWIRFLSGDAADESLRPQLIITTRS